MNSALTGWRKAEEKEKGRGVNIIARDVFYKAQMDHAGIVPGQGDTHSPTTAEVFELFVLHGWGKAQAKENA